MIGGGMVSISGEHVYQESGSHVNISGQPINVSGSHVWISGQHVYVESGVHVIADVAVEVSSGLWVDGVSGVHVFVESGVHVVADVNVEVSSGLWVDGVSGQHVFVESGIWLASGQGGMLAWDGTQWIRVVIDGQNRILVSVSGQHVYQESGAFVTANSRIYLWNGTQYVRAVMDARVRMLVTVSGDHVYQESGAFVTAHGGVQVSGTIDIASGAVVVDSGLHVWMSGQHVYQESGAFVTTQPGIQISGAVIVSGTLSATAEISGQMVHIGCAAISRTGRLVQAAGGASGGHPGSGGMSMCVSGYWCSGPIHSLVIKNRTGNDNVYVGGINCKPYSGYGYELEEAEAVNLDMCDVCDIWIYALTSGQFVTWIGTDY